MLWGSFGAIHLITLAISAGIIAGLYFILRGRSERVQMTVLGICSFSGIAAILFNLLEWGSPIEYLPLHLCSLNALVLPFAVFTKSKRLCNLTLLWALGALLALVINTAQANYEIFSLTFLFYYIPHTLEFGIPVLIFLLKYAKADVKCILSTVGITFGAYTVIHLINVLINDACIKRGILDYAGNVISVNYMYSIKPENPVLQLFYNILPHSYWYMFLAIPIIVIYLGCIYSKDILRLIRDKKRNEEA
jgi:uncharacterized membrane protein YwaF